MVSTKGTTSLSLEWVETSPGVFERDLDGLEKFFQFIAQVGQLRADRLNWCCFAGIKISTNRSAQDFVSNVKQAWKALRVELPSLSAKIESGRWVYRAVNENDWDEWLNETFHVHKTGQSARQLFPLAESPIPQRAELHALPSTQEILLMVPHTHVDGLGMAMFLDQLMHKLVEPQETNVELTTGKESVHLIPSVAVTARIPQKMTPFQHEIYEKSMLDFFSDRPSIKLATRNARMPAGRTKLKWMTLSAEQTSTLAARCKELGFSVTSAMQAALGRTCRIQSGQSQIENHCNMAIYDARSKHVNLQKYPLERLTGSYIFVMPALFKHPLNQSFVDSAKAAMAEFFRFTNNDVVCAASQHFGPDLMRLLTAAACQPGAKSKDTPGDLNHSSLGIIDKWVKSKYQDTKGSGCPAIEVLDLWFALDLLHPNILVDTWTFKGMLSVELVYNETFHGEDSVSLICSLIREQLTQGLHLDLDFSMRSPGKEEWNY